MLDKDTLVFFAKFIESQTGIAYSEVTFFQLEGRLETIAKQLGFPSVSALAQSALRDGIRGAMKDLVLDLATNNETSFFRDTSLFDALTQHVLPELARQHVHKTCRIWSAASSTGQEIYSIAMLIQELQKSMPSSSWELTASDISERVLAKASKGLYTQLEVQRGLSAQRLLNNFEQIEDTGDGAIWRAKSTLQKMISFKRLNLIESWPSTLGHFSLILCRNVLIYQTVEQKRLVLQQLTRHLEPNGLLVLGGAESLIGLSEEYLQEQVGSTYMYRLKPREQSQAS